MKDKLFKILSDVLDIDIENVNENLGQDNTEDWDSVTHLTLMAEIEDEFEISLEPEEIEKMKNVAAILKILNDERQS